MVSVCLWVGVRVRVGIYFEHAEYGLLWALVFVVHDDDSALLLRALYAV